MRGDRCFPTAQLAVLEERKRLAEGQVGSTARTAQQRGSSLPPFTHVAEAPWRPFSFPSVQKSDR